MIQGRKFHHQFEIRPSIILGLLSSLMCSAQRVGFFSIGSGWVLDKISGSGSGSGRVGVLKNMIGYFWVSFLIQWYFWVFSGISENFQVILVVLDIISFFRGSQPNIKDFSNKQLGLKILQKFTNNLQNKNTVGNIG